MVRGHVKWFNVYKGWGFLTREDNGSDVFIHYSKIEMSGFKKLKSEDEVVFDIQESDKGPIAIDVKLANYLEEWKNSI